LGFPIETARTRFIEDVAFASLESVFKKTKCPVCKQDTLSLIQLTLIMLDKRSREEEDPDHFIRTVLRRMDGKYCGGVTEGD
jgi:hypothetical protein